MNKKYIILIITIILLIPIKFFYIVNEVYVGWGENTEGLLHVQEESNTIMCKIGLTSNDQLCEYKH